MRITRTPEETFQAGWDDGEHDRPLSAEELTREVARHKPYLRPLIESEQDNESA